MMKKHHINVPDKEAALGEYEVIMTTADGKTIKKIITNYTYSRVFETLCEQYENENSISVLSINIRAIR
ncbi:hypothetical protein ABE218_08530 [Bacillus smithii]|uniref:hypothetical protein n=1 Tax=Bacillus smithii TaxID=1479 RepID=UPI003D2059F8